MPSRKSWPRCISPNGRGLRIRIFRNKKKVHDETLECDAYSKADLAAAVKRRDWIEARLKAGIPVAGEESPFDLFESVAQDYLNCLEAKSRVRREYTRILNHFWLPSFHGRIVQEIRTSDIKRILADWDVSPKTKKNRMIPLTGVFKHAEVYPPPTLKIRLKRSQKNPVERYRPEERDRVLSYLQGDARAYFEILFGCGLRPGECLGLEWAAYDGEFFEIYQQITARRLDKELKTYEPRRVYIPTRVRPAVNSLASRFKGEFLFLNSIGGPHLDTDIFNAAWQKAHKSARVRYRTPYACRHTRAAELLSMGILPGDAAEQLGHSLQMFYQTYAEFINEYQSNQDWSRFEGGKSAAGS